MQEPRAVEVEDGGVWRRGILEAWRRDPERGWLGYCRWTADIAQGYVQWVPAERVRPRD